MTTLDPRWEVRNGVRYWSGETFPEPTNYALKAYLKESVKAELPTTSTCSSKRGTPAGAKRHYRAKEKLCDDCAQAQRDSRRRWRESRAKCADCSKSINRAAKRCATCEYTRRAMASSGVHKCEGCGGTCRDRQGCETCIVWAERVAVRQSWESLSKEGVAA